MARPPEILISKADIQARVAELAQQVHQDFQEDIVIKKLVIVPVLEGAATFADDLLSELEVLGSDVRRKSIQVGSYGNERESSRQPKVLTQFNQAEFKGAHALVVEDILETGHTLTEIIRVLTEVAGFTAITIMVLLAKEGMQEVDVPVEYVGFRIGQEWVWGYGIDDQHYGRNKRISGTSRKMTSLRDSLTILSSITISLAHGYATRFA